MLPTSRSQFERTRPLRLAAYRRAELSRRLRVLEVGAGECPVAAEVVRRTGRPVWALDRLQPGPVPAGVRPIRAEACSLPFGDGAFDALLFHFVLLWLADPVAALVEGRRVLAAGGALLLLSEPDLTARRDEPDTGLGLSLASAVARAGGHPDAGARLGEWLAAAGFRADVQRAREEWVDLPDPEETLHEVAFLRESGTLSAAEAEQIAAAERGAAGRRRVLLPLAWAVAWK